MSRSTCNDNWYLQYEIDLAMICSRPYDDTVTVICDRSAFLMNKHGMSLDLYVMTPSDLTYEINWQYVQL